MKQETLEEAAERLFGKHFNGMHYDDISDKHIIKYGLALAKWQQEQIGKSEFLQKLRATLSDAEARRLIFEQFKNK